MISRNGGFLYAHGYIQDFLDLAMKYGPVTAFQLIRFEQQTQRCIEQVSLRQGIDCDLDKHITPIMVFPDTNNCHDDKNIDNNHNHDTRKDSVADQLSEMAGPQWFRKYVLPWIGIQVLESDREVEQVLRLDPSSADTATTFAAAIVDIGDYTTTSCHTFWPAKFVYGIAKYLIENRGLHVQTSTPVFECHGETC